jgi:magnesium-transporting ATPase (P-type)
MTERQNRRLQEELKKNQRATVIRDNRMQEIPATELVVGDLCFIKSGKNYK